MPDERYLKDIAVELKLIRKELQRMNRDPLEKITRNIPDISRMAEEVVDGRTG